MTARPGTVGGSGSPGVSPLPAIALVAPDPDDRALVRDALLAGPVPCEVIAVADAAGLEDLLADGGDGPDRPAPALVVVDLDAGESALAIVERIKGDPVLRRVPVVALSRAAEPAWVARAYDAGVNTVLPRPVTFLALVRLVKVLVAYWLEVAALPGSAA